MLIELSRSTPQDLIPTWRTRFRADLTRAERTRQLTAVGHELIGYAEQATRPLPKETQALQASLDEGRALPAWLTDHIPETEHESLRHVLRTMSTRVQRELCSPGTATDMDACLARAQAEYETLRQAATVDGALPAVLGVTDVHFRLLVADARDVRVLRTLIPAHGKPKNAADVAEHFLTHKGVIAPSLTWRERLAARGLTRVATLAGGESSRLGRALIARADTPPRVSALRAQHTAAAGTALPTLEQAATTTLPPAARDALRHEVERRLVVRAGLAQEQITADVVADHFVQGLPNRRIATLDATAQRFLRERAAAATVDQKLEQMAEHTPDTLTDALRLLPPASREALWIGTLSRGGEPPGSLLRSIASNPTLSLPDKSHLSHAVMGMARARPAQMLQHTNASRISNLTPETPWILSLETDRFAAGLALMTMEAHAAPTPMAKGEAARSIRAYAMELEIEQLDAAYAHVTPGDPLPTSALTYTDAVISLGSVTREPAAMQRQVEGLPWSPEAFWDCLKAAEAPLSAPSPGIAATLALSALSSTPVAPPAGPAPAPPTAVPTAAPTAARTPSGPAARTSPTTAPTMPPAPAHRRGTTV